MLEMISNPHSQSMKYEIAKECKFYVWNLFQKHLFDRNQDQCAWAYSGNHCQFTSIETCKTFILNIAIIGIEAYHLKSFPVLVRNLQFDIEFDLFIY